MFRRLLHWLMAPRRYIRDWATRHALGLTLSGLVLAFVVVFFADRIFISIYPGQVGVIWKRFDGTRTAPADLYDEGFYLISPLNIMYKYNLRFQILRRKVTALTDDGLEVTGDVGLLYRVKRDLAGRLHKEVGEDYLNSLIIPTLDATLRNIVSSISAQELYVSTEHALRDTHLVETSVLDEAMEEVGEEYIEVRDLSILRLILPERIQAAIQQKREEEQLALLYDFRLEREEKEAQRKRIEAGGIRDFQTIITGGLTDRYLKFKGIEATLALAQSANSKVVVVGDSDGLPLIGSVPLVSPEVTLGVPSASLPPQTGLDVPTTSPPSKTGLDVPTASLPPKTGLDVPTTSSPSEIALDVPTTSLPRRPEKEEESFTMKLSP